MKQLIFMLFLMATGTVGTFVVDPALGVGVYYLLALLRPQSLWEWSLPPNVAWSYYVAAATLLAGAASAAGFSARATPSRRLTAAHGAVLLFGAWVGVTYATARDQEAALPWFVEYVKIFTMFAASLFLIPTIKHVWMLLCMAALTVGYLAYEINVMYLTSGAMNIARDGLCGSDNNIIGLTLAMAVPLCYFAWEGGRSRWRWLFLGLVPVLLHAVLMTFSRGAMVSLIAVAPLIGWRSRHRGRVALIGLGVLALLPLLAGPEIRARFFTISAHDTDESAQSRRQSWAAGLQIARENPIFGVGVRNSNLLSRQYGADMEGRTIHSQYLQIAADNGFVGLALYLGAVALVWRGLARTRGEAARHAGPGAARVHALTSAIECSLAVFLFGGIFLSLDAFELPYLLLLLGAQTAALTCPAENLAFVRRPTRLLAPA